MRRLIPLLLLTVSGCTTLDTPPANPQAVVAQRVAIMKGFGGALGASAAYVQGKGGAPAAHAKLTAAYATTEELADLFPRGTALGDKGVAASRALPTIFTNRSDFAAKIDATARALGALDALVMRGAKGEVALALDRAKATCASCHNKYRAADD